MGAKVSTYGKQCSDDKSSRWKDFFGGEVDPHGSVSYAGIVNLLIDANVGAFVFWCGISSAQIAQKALRIHSATPVLPQIIGTTAVIYSAAAAIHFADFPRLTMQELDKLDKSHGNLRIDRSAAIAGIRSHASDKLDSFPYIPHPGHVLITLAIFKVLGGRMLATAPSDYRYLGAFHQVESSASATHDYAGERMRQIIQAFGRKTGCHTCGSRKHELYHADHMPPNEFAKRQNASFISRWLGRTVTQRYYPQCQTCSNLQGPLVKQTFALRYSKWNPTLRLHIREIRAYHLTGFWLILFASLRFSSSG